MKEFIGLMIAVAILYLSATVTAQASTETVVVQAERQGIYATVQAGTLFVDDAEIPNVFETDPGLALIGAAGYQFPSGLRVEGELGWRTKDTRVLVFVDKIKREDSALNIAVNAVYEIDAGPVRPYVGGGIGLAVVNFDLAIRDEALDDTRTAFAYQAIGGVAVPISKNLDVVTDYRYTATTGDLGVAAHNVMAGLRFRF